VSMSADHPDLVEIDRHIRSQLDRVLRAEQEAADLTRRRSATLRDRLIDLEETAETVTIVHPDGETVGIVENVGTDHVDVLSVTGAVILPLASVRQVRLL
jgi:hypothetical protein